MFSNKARHIILFIFPLNKTSNLKKNTTENNPSHMFHRAFIQNKFPFWWLFLLWRSYTSYHTRFPDLNKALLLIIPEQLSLPPSWMMQNCHSNEKDKHKQNIVWFVDSGFCCLLAAAMVWSIIYLLELGFRLIFTCL